ncbi:MAG: formate dehydrogenase accessory sulfurtransferase FdhD [Candidatus Omnitrophota bacterium]
MIETLKIIRIKNNSREIIDDPVVCEIPLTINIGSNELVTLLCCPSDLEDLVTGFLFTSGLIREASDIKRIVINSEQWVAYVDLADLNIDKELVFKRLYTSGCGKGTIFYNTADIINRIKITSGFRIEAAKINTLMLDFQKKSDIYLKTGGVHSAALADSNGVVIFAEDIGRHNAIDKVIGQGLRRGSHFDNKIMITSGRVSSEVLLKTQKCRVPVVISRSAPTDQAVKLAKDMRITLVGFARGNRLNIYSVEERID